MQAKGFIHHSTSLLHQRCRSFNLYSSYRAFIDTPRIELTDTDIWLQQLQAFFFEHTEHFLHEMVSFARSRLDMAAYDRHARYPGRLHEVAYSRVGSLSSCILPNAYDKRKEKKEKFSYLQQTLTHTHTHHTHHTIHYPHSITYTLPHSLTFSTLQHRKRPHEQAGAFTVVSGQPPEDHGLAYI